MGLFNANSDAEAQREAAIQARRRAIVERALAPRLAKVFNKQAKKSELAWLNGDVDSVALSFEGHAKDIADVLIPAYVVAINRTVRAVFDEAGKAGIQRREKKRDAASFLDSFIEKWVLSMALTESTTIAETSFDLVRAAIVDGVVEAAGERAIGSMIVDCLGGSIAKSRSQLIARTEVNIASQKASIESVRTLDLPPMLKRWIPAGGARTRDTHADMLKHPAIAMDEKFAVRRERGGTDYMDHPCSRGGSAGNVCNCRCVTTFKRRA